MPDLRRHPGTGGPVGKRMEPLSRWAVFAEADQPPQEWPEAVPFPVGLVLRRAFTVPLPSLLDSSSSLQGLTKGLFLTFFLRPRCQLQGG